ncbi:methyltransferase domain-containing protein [Streptomyces cavernicola]|uniref:Protein-L-isoaspartate O-methyltransferase n=1 Tax=Streptomyces cavernicola TaxID=3043613 RepID=A0ABT6SM77_9ACTN|nr:methyltransferase domain-containing protein [Streptomyces sp. B-S-A6]MDI3409295.1 methyltransferase domain-containing protein [Streptomyces sp. B-S-A6]
MTDHRTVCETALETMGAFRSPWLRAAFRTIERTDFVPDRIWLITADDEGTYPLVDRAGDESAWLAAVWDPHRSVAIQLDDGDVAATGPASGDFTSSVSAPDIVFEKLNHLDLEPGHRVLEIGLGSGYHTALLCERGAQVTSIDIDPDLVDAATARLKRAGYPARTVRGDGLDGHPANAPYDRIIATASVRDIPDAWREQAADGAIVLTPFNTAFADGGLLKLRAQDGVLSGTVVGSASYMPVRAHRWHHRLPSPDAYVQSASPVDPARVLDGTWAQSFALGLRVPDIHRTCRTGEDGRQAQLWDTGGTSVTVVAYAGWSEEGAVTQWGPRNLWAEVVAAYTAWRTSGQPHVTRYGLTYDDTGRTLWLDAPDKPVRLPPDQ